METVNDIGSTPEGSDGEYSLDDDDQLQPEDTLVDRGVDDVLDEGYSPPDHQPSWGRHGLTEREQREGETLDERLAEEETDIGVTDPLDDIAAEEDVEKNWRSHESDRSDDYDGDDQAGAARSGRLVAPDEGSGIDREKDAVAGDVGIDGAGASAEEAAVHYLDADEVEWSEESDTDA
ncbi:hypothetical protein GIY30_11570 [Gordonia sp. HNM0687]|uniref:DUF5709 domain-containing protein n=1 Tax=Gordonia mangrovi TaxID=2665643 RepID=A0A6L7GQ32_9ACTN|nr:DUF5709 domain-containing protein [Gordonia mangrovi]MDY6808056.1 DUF5709 domain-containing protein [Actinomycetota bacterium]MXP21986.1 hypothetical protein [Gordonia mangrovi]UVF76343.1 DUF5709 domain-containing protein [Gordonia mangrovi]